MGAGGGEFPVTIIEKGLPPKPKKRGSMIDDELNDTDEHISVGGGDSAHDTSNSSVGETSTLVVNQQMIKVLKGGEEKKPSPSKEEKKGQGVTAAPTKPSRVQVTPKKATKPASALKARKSPRGAKEVPQVSTVDMVTLKYTTNQPRVELHPLDSRKLKLYFADSKFNAKIDAGRCIEMRVANRKVRDVVALLIRCYTAQIHFMNAKIIASVTGEDDESVMGVDDSVNLNLGPKVYSVSDVLCELDQVKRELFN